MTQSKIGVKGQTMGLDLLIAMAIFLMVMAAILSIWANSSEVSKKQVQEIRMTEMAENTLESLVRDSGSPEDWEMSCALDFNSLGLARRSLVLDANKLEQLVWRVEGSTCDWNYTFVRESLFIADNNLFFRLLDPATGFSLKSRNGSDLNIGTDPEKTEEPERLLQARATKIVSYEGGEAIAELTLYRKK